MVSPVDHPEQIDFIGAQLCRRVRFSLSQAKALAKQAGGKLNDVVLAIFERRGQALSSLETRCAAGENH